jgi:hypothetical protein
MLPNGVDTGVASDGEGRPSVEVDLKAGPIDVFLAITEASQRAGLATEVVQPARPPDRPCQIAARLARPPAAVPAAPGPRFADPGPALLVYELREVGKGHVRVRITQCGFGDLAAWDAAFEGWQGREGPTRWLPPVGRPGGGYGLPAAGTPQWETPAGRSVHGLVVAALVQQIEAACVRLGATRRAVDRLPASGARWRP